MPSVWAIWISPLVRGKGQRPDFQRRRQGLCRQAAVPAHHRHEPAASRGSGMTIDFAMSRLILRHCQMTLHCIPSQASVSPRSEEQIESEASERQRQQTAELEVDEEGNALHHKESSVEAVSDSLVNQDFLLDQDKTVGEVLIENCLEVKDFARYEIGRGIDTEE